MKLFYILLPFIPISLILLFGVEDRTEWFYNNEHRNDFIEDYRYQYKDIIVNIGVVVSHYTMLIVVSAILMVVAWIAYKLYSLIKMEKNQAFNT